MSDILIKGMEMPANCHSCPMCLMRFCQAGDRELSERETRPNAKRPEDCPLVPVPPHGRLIDADAAKEFLKPVDSIRDYEPEWTWGELYESNCNAIDKLPTIIPAEEGE